MPGGGQFSDLPETISGGILPIARNVGRILPKFLQQADLPHFGHIAGQTQTSKHLGLEKDLGKMNHLFDEADDYKMWADWSPRSKRQPVNLRILASAAVVATSAVLIADYGVI